MAWGRETTPDVLVEVAPPDPTRTTCATSWGRSPRRRWCSTAPGTSIVPYKVRPGDRGGDPRRPLRDLRGRRAWPARPRGGQGEPPDPRLRPRAPGRVGDHPGHDRAADGEAAGANRGAPDPFAVEPDRPRPHPARPRHRQGAAAADTPTPPSISWPPIRPIAWSVTCGERLHPATRLLLNESAHVEGWACDHELHAFNALWDMDEIMAANFMVFADVVEREDYDLWVGDEGWDLDYFLHENPKLKRAPYVFVTDFIGVLPMRDDRSSTEFRRAWEKNAENIDHLRLHPDVRDLSIMVGDEDGRARPRVRARPAQHAAVGARALPLLRLHVPLRPRRVRGRGRVRHELGYRDGERAILVSVGRHRVPDATCCASARRRSPSWPTDARHAHAAGRRSAAGPRELPGGAAASTCGRTCPISSGTTPPPIWPSCRAASPPRWSWRPSRRRSSTSRCAIISSSNFHVARRLDRLGAGVRMDYD